MEVTHHILVVVVWTLQCSSLHAADAYLGTGVSIGCFRCKSRNFSDRSCHDPMAKPPTALVDTCTVALGSGRILVPANYCIKVVGISETTGEEYIIRDCILERPEDECSDIEIDGDVIKRCTWTCNSHGCNGRLPHKPSCLVLTLLFVTIVCRFT